MKIEAERGPSPKRSKTAIVLWTVGTVALVGAAVFGGKIAVDYRDGIQASQVAAETALEQADQRADDAQAFAAEAADSAEAASAAVTSVQAEEAAVAAQAAAVEAAKVAYVAKGLTEEGKCPAGTKAGEVNADGSEGLCAPTGPQGQECAEYTDNVCTGWLKP